jgi:GMP synthase (glutamine-hydrolysing)
MLSKVRFVVGPVKTGVPVWGSCWGLQIATVALGGSVRRNPRGRELAIARAITVTEAGRRTCRAWGWNGTRRQLPLTWWTTFNR